MILNQKNKKLEKELLEQRLMYAELQRNMIAQQEEAKVREEALVKGYNDLQESMDKQSERTNNMMQEMLDMMKKQAKPQNAHLISLFTLCFVIDCASEQYCFILLLTVICF